MPGFLLKICPDFCKNETGLRISHTDYNVKNICVLKDFICQGGRPKNSRTCMLVGWGSRHFAAEAMELKVPAKVLICNFVLPTGVSILRYINISILIKYSIFSGFVKKKTQM